MINHTIYRFEIMIFNENENNANRSVNIRIDQLKFSFNTIFANVENMLIGKGIGSFKLLYEGIDGRGYPHNIFVEIWFELGLVGLLIFLYFLFIVMVRKISNDYLNHYLMLYILLNMAKSNSIVDIRTYFLFFALFMLSEINLIEL